MLENRLTPDTAKLLKDELLFQRATQTYLWALPLINTMDMKVGSEKAFGAGYNILPVWKKRLDAKTLVTTLYGPKPHISVTSGATDASNPTLAVWAHAVCGLNVGVSWFRRGAGCRR